MKLTLSNSLSMPVVGLGTWQASPDVVKKAVSTAFEVGYRLIDTAFNYGNEEAIGEAIKTWIDAGNKREDLFITTKLPNFGIRPGDVEKYLTLSLQRLGLSYVDLYLIHHPFGFLSPPPGTEAPDLDLNTDHIAVWKALEEQVVAGRVKSIGLSNFNATQVEKITAAAKIPPANLQVELHAYLQQPQLIAACNRLGITITAYAPLGSPHARSHFKNKYGIEVNEDSTNPLTDPSVLEIAQRHEATPAQVLLRFLIQLGIAVVPKSASSQRIAENFQALKLSLTESELETLKTLDRGERGRIFDFLFYKGVENHPEYPFTKSTSASPAHLQSIEMMELSPMTPTADSGLDCHLKPEITIPAGLALDSPTAFIMTVDGASACFPTDVSYIREAEKNGELHDDLQNKDLLYILSQRFENIPPPITYAVQRKVEEEVPTPRVIKKDRAENTDPQITTSHQQPLRVCVYLMSNTAVDLELDDVNVTVNDMLHSILLDENIGLPRTAAIVFSLWMCSGLVEIQLRPQHKPFEMRARWRDITKRFSSASPSRRAKDEPSLTLQRNVFLSRREEEAICDEAVLTLLYEEAKYNVLEGRYPCETENVISLAGLQARVELGPYNPQVHTNQFFRERLSLYLPEHIRRATWSWLPISSKKNSLEMKLLEQYKRIPPNTPVKKLITKYLEFCKALPYYGAAFFQGQVEQPVRGLTSLITHQDLPVLIGINDQGIYVIDQIESTLLLGLRYEDMSWDFAKPSQEDNPDCLPCLFIQFRVLENGTRVSKILQIFSRQAVIMDALIAVFVDTSNPKEESPRPPAYETSTDSDDTHMPLTNQKDLSSFSCLANKLSKLTLATFDDEGHCIGQMGSWSFSY